jgi:tripartite-type tricarboxylate transporter receptor subunit TctC
MVDVAAMRKISSYDATNKMSVQQRSGGTGSIGFARTCAESAGTLLSRLQNNSTPSSSNEPDSPTPMSQLNTIQPIPSLVGTSLDKQFEVFNFVGLAGNWKHFSAQNIGSSPKVIFKD